MKKEFADILRVAIENIQKNPSIVGSDTDVVSERYLNWLVGEVEEVRKEVKPSNDVYLVDELSDILWVYTVLLALLEERGMIANVDDVFAQAYQKYTERTPGFLEGSDEVWQQIKQKQKAVLEKRHSEKYGN